MRSNFDPGRTSVFIFDVNGVLLDSNRANAEAMAEAFTSDPVSRRRIAKFYLGLTGIDRGAKIRIIQEKLVGKPFAGGEFELRWERFGDLASKSMAAAPLTPGCREVLAELGRRKKVRVALSNTPEAELKNILDAHALAPLLDIIRGGGDWPKAESLARFLGESGIEPLDCVLMGDGKGDLNAAKQCGMPFFGIDAGTDEFRAASGLPLMARFGNLAEWGGNILGMEFS
ncbi:MAG: HAD hydrolase-like protein [Syntrophobacter sp.]